MILLVLLAGMLLPGCWVAFATSRFDINYATRSALALVFAPFVVALEWWALRYAGLSADTAVLATLWLNVPSVLLVAIMMRRVRPVWRWRPVLLGTAVFLAVALCTAIPWLYDSAFRSFSWHGLLHTDIIYALARGGVVPEDPELAGVKLAYPWLGHVYWLVLARAADLSPTVVYLVSNLVLLGATGVIAHSTAKRLGASDAMALSLPVLLALGPDLLGLIGWSFLPPNDNGVLWAVLGDLRYAPFLLKFVTFEAMTFGLALFAALIYFGVASLDQKHVAAKQAIVLLTVPAIAALYPNLFPAAVLTVAALGATVLFTQRADLKRALLQLLAPAVGLAVVAVIGAYFVKLYTVDRGQSVVALTPLLGIAKKVVTIVLVLGPLALAAAWAWRREQQMDRRAALLFLMLAAAASVALNVAMRLGGLNEYKFVFTASMALLPAAMLGIELFLLRRSTQQWALAGVLVVMLAAVMAAYAGRRVPRFAAKPFAARESSFWLAAEPGTPEAGWTTVVRNQTPTNTVLVTRRPDFHASAFAGRSFFVSSEGQLRHFGYNLIIRNNLVKLRGYSPELYDGRVALLDRLYAGAPEPDMARMLTELTALGRPLAIAFAPGDNRALLQFLQRSHEGQTLYNADGRAVYYLPAARTQTAARHSANTRTATAHDR